VVGRALDSRRVHLALRRLPMPSIWSFRMARWVRATSRSGMCSMIRADQVHRAAGADGVHHSFRGDSTRLSQPIRLPGDALTLLFADT
jgi:hypothetical protein